MEIINKALVSIIIPCYQQGRYLESCINSLKAQTHVVWEALIIDDGSTDNTEAVALFLASEDERVKYIKKINAGLAAARNTGLSLAKGQYIQFLDSDDLLESNKLEYQLKIFIENPELEMVYGNAKYFLDGKYGRYRRSPSLNLDDYNFNCIDENWISNRWNSKGSILKKINNKNMFPVCTPLVKRSAIDKIGIFNEKLKAYEDWDYWLRGAALDIKYLYFKSPNTDALIRVHPLSMTKNPKLMSSAYFDFRLSCQNLISKKLFFARLEWVVKLIESSSLLGLYGRHERYYKMRRATNNPIERLFVEIGYVGDSGGVLFPAFRFVLKKIKIIYSKAK